MSIQDRKENRQHQRENPQHEKKFHKKVQIKNKTKQKTKSQGMLKINSMNQTNQSSHYNTPDQAEGEKFGHD